MAAALYAVNRLRVTSGLIVLAAVVLPVLLGLYHSAAAGFGHMPALGAEGPDLAAWRALLAVPGLWRAAALSLWTGLAATALAFGLAVVTVAALPQRMAGLRRLLAPLLAAPHAALAIGLAFVLAPSGWIARAIAPLAGWVRPPDLATVGDPWGLALILGLVLKELPFLILVLIGATTQIPMRAQMAAGRSTGHGRAAIWLCLLLPQLWPLIRLPVMVVVAFSVSVVDMALILGPSNPPTLSVLVARLFTDPDLRALLPASAGACLQMMLAAAAMALVWGAAAAGRLVRGAVLGCGARLRGLDRVAALPLAGTAVLVALAALALMGLALWSVAFTWRWPDLWPGGLSLRAWQGRGGWMRALVLSLGIAAAAAGLALVLAVAWLDGGDRAGRRGLRGWMRIAVYLPLLLPQISVLVGVSGLALRHGVAPLPAVIWGHMLFVFPYVMIALAGPWAALDPRLERTAAALGAGPWRRLWHVKLPALLAPILTAAAIGFSVSIAQYLPTLFLGGGRIATLTTEAVALSSGSDRRVAAVHAALQAALPWAVFLLALIVPQRLHRNRRALNGDTA
ncbi:ABC transporter permease [Falsirhodobacter algicola]|uniref:ABC transporter permease subunit n=1 Tax=Falsirhodobacter algicola TaxID=2692330 RepID=A0A8J8MV70_9RHOB|nr:ABC transporter permease subunit [Falsirhodobacter algicola]QUS37026.1 ABC transporter permease subunit [Falsirhodobacter algicola]